MKRFIFIITILNFVFNFSYSNEKVLVVDGTFEEFSISDYLQAFTDESNALIIDEILQKKNDSLFRHTNSSNLNYGLSNNSHWLRFTIENRSEKTENLIFSINTCLINHIDFYQVEDLLITKQVHTGRIHKFNTRDEDHRNFAFNLKLKPHENYTYYVKLHNDGLATYVPISLASKSEFYIKDSFSITLLGVIYGAFSLTILLSLLLYISSRETLFLKYSVYVISVSFFFLLISGIVSKYILPNNPKVLDFSFNLFFTLFNVTCISFSQAFLKLKTRLPFWYKVLNSFKGLFFMLTVFCLLDYPIHTISTLSIGFFTQINFLVLIGIAILSKYRGDKKAIYIIVSNIIWMTGAFVKVWGDTGVYNQNVFTYNAVFVGFLFEASILGYAVIKDYKKQIEFADFVSKTNTQLEAANKKLDSANKTKDKFFSIVAHDLRNPFNSLITISNILIDKFDKFSSKEQLEYYNTINRSSERAYKLLENLLEWSRVQTGNIKCTPTYIDLNTIVIIVRNFLLPQANNKNINISNAIKYNTIVFIDKNMISSVISNLVSNAIKYTSDNGEVTISSLNKGDHIEIAISDTGLGIPKEVIPKLFKIEEKYKTSGTRGEQGTGLGLVLCKEFVEQHNGELWVESELEKGSVLKFTLPSHLN